MSISGRIWADEDDDKRFSCQIELATLRDQMKLRFKSKCLEIEQIHYKDTAQLMGQSD